MSRFPISLVVAVFAVALVAVPASFASARDHRAVRVQGTCTQHSTSKLKLGREDRGIEVEFQVDQNRNGVPWNVTFSRNGKTIAAFTATTRGPSGSFEIRRLVAGRVGTDRITAVARRSGETCTADSAPPKTKAAAPAAATRSGHDVGDDHGRHSGGHA
jgi:hypothetical protein